MQTESKRTFFHKRPLKPFLWYWVVLPSAIIGSGKFIDFSLNFKELTPPWWVKTMAITCIIAGFAVIEIATRNLQKYGKGTPYTGKPSTRLVTNGIYKYCRHPMFFGYDIAGLGCIILFGSLGTLLIAFPIYLCLQNYALKNKEEARLIIKYGEDYRRYIQQVPRLIPNFRRKI